MCQSTTPPSLNSAAWLTPLHCSTDSRLLWVHSVLLVLTCILQSTKEKHVILSFTTPQQDKAQPETQARVFGDVSFNAVLAVDDPSAMSLVRQPGSDGFRVDSTAMFQVFFSFCFSWPMTYFYINMCHSTIQLHSQRALKPYEGKKSRLYYSTFVFILVYILLWLELWINVVLCRPQWK